jgi:hypothetical protein
MTHAKNNGEKNLTEGWYEDLARVSRRLEKAKRHDCKQLLQAFS